MPLLLHNAKCEKHVMQKFNCIKGKFPYRICIHLKKIQLYFKMLLMLIADLIR